MKERENYAVADIGLAKEGRDRIDWAWQYMPLVRLIRDKECAGGRRPLDGHTIACCLHLEAKTACLLKVFKDLGAVVTAAGSNPLSTQDPVCAALAEYGVHVFSKHGMTDEEYGENLHRTLAWEPDIIIDDGADTVAMICSDYPELAPGMLGGCEETTTGIKRLKAMDADGVLKFPMLAVNDALSKYLFDNRYGTGQSVWDGIMRTTNCVVAGKNVVVVGYGWCGKGVAARAAGLGAHVIVVEINAHKALEAHMDGFRVMDMADASRCGEIFITVTGNTQVIRREHFEIMRDGALLANAGHFDVEVYVPHLEALAVKSYDARVNVRTYELDDGRRLHLLAMGRLVNLASGDGHPIEIMDTSFATQLLCALYIAGGASLQKGLQRVPDSIDDAVARYKIESLGLKLERLTPVQEKYLKEWRE
ncbi:MAG: adenosylhomocysteinase [Synergistaceae bacterium]|jgi:adenosylhomocysteinase|nr:adenosylhomocysteinase [Synergistaceae bacterium]